MKQDHMVGTRMVQFKKIPFHPIYPPPIPQNDRILFRCPRNVSQIFLLFIYMDPRCLQILPAVASSSK